MNFEGDIGPDEQRFLQALHEKLGGDPAGSASLFDVGEALGMDRAASSRIAENLMSWELVEIRTLSGAIGITQAAADWVGAPNSAGLGSGPVIGDSDRQSVEAVTTDLKSRVGEMGLEFDGLSELTADLKTIDVQLTSSKPKTAIIRACFESIADLLSQAGKSSDLYARVRDLLNT